MKDKKIGAGVRVVMLKEGKILLGKRHRDKKKADSELNGEGTWSMPGGKLEFKETFEEGAKREVLEETNIKLRNAQVICVNNDIIDKAHFITIGLLAIFERGDFDGEAEVMEPDEMTEWGWFGPKDLPKKIFLPSAKILKNYFQKKIYIRDN